MGAGERCTEIERSKSSEANKDARGFKHQYNQKQLALSLSGCRHPSMALPGDVGLTVMSQAGDRRAVIGQQLFFPAILRQRQTPASELPLHFLLAYTTGHYSTTSLALSQHSFNCLQHHTVTCQTSLASRSTNFYVPYAHLVAVAASETSLASLFRIKINLSDLPYLLRPATSRPQLSQLLTGWLSRDKRNK